MTPEEQARQQIDSLLGKAGWTIQNMKDLNLGASLGVAVREYPIDSGEADYLLFVDRKPAGVIEAKPVGTTLSGVADQSEKYLTGALRYYPNVREPLRFGYESTGLETFFRDLCDPNPRSRRIFAFHKPETLLDWMAKEDTLRARLQGLPLLNTHGLRDC